MPFEIAHVAEPEAEADSRRKAQLEFGPQVRYAVMGFRKAEASAERDGKALKVFAALSPSFAAVGYADDQEQRQQEAEWPSDFEYPQGHAISPFNKFSLR
jgi:hypothetical protein